MNINLNGCNISTEEIDRLLERGEKYVYMIDEDSEIYWDLDSAKEAAKALKDRWIGDLNICKYAVNVAHSESEGYHLINETGSPLDFTGEYWAVE